jgi:NTE family protein
LAAGTAVATEPDPGFTPAAGAERPRIGLALGGGGARGGAHVGVLKVLDELRVPVDCVAGTSMGALVGATFASGVPADRIEQMLGEIDWPATIAFQGWRAARPMQRKVSGITYSNSIEFSIWGGRLHSGSGFIPSQHIEGQLRLLVGSARGPTDFDLLPLPFRAVATDLATSSMAVLGEGDLAEAMRASMAVPGLFAPVVRGDQVLADGGMLRNVPVDVARELCADVVIAVSLPLPPRSPDEFQSLFTAAGRTIDVVVEANEQAQLELLGPADVHIRAPVGDVGSADFDRVMETIPHGEAAARQMAEALSRYALPEEEYRRWRERLQRADTPAVRIAEIRFAPLRHASAEYLATRLKTRPGDVVTPMALEVDMSRVFASGDFERVDYRLHPTSDGDYRLEIEAEERHGGTDFVRFDLGLSGSAGGDLLFVVRADHRREWVNMLGGQWRNALQLGQLSSVETAFYQPLDTAQRFFVEPTLAVQRSLEDFYVDGDRVASYRLTDGTLRLDAGVNLSNQARLRAGVLAGSTEFDLDTGSIPLLDEERTRDSGFVLGALFDTRDTPYLPTRGSFAQFEYRHANDWFGGETSYRQVEGVAGRALPWRDQVLLLAAGAGHTLGGELPASRYFSVGGARSFPSAQRGELRGRDYWSGSATLMMRLADIQALFGQVFYGGFGLHALGVADPLEGGGDQTILGASFTLGARTPVGPLLVTLGADDNGSVELHVALGRPITEGSLLDRLQ